jgi:hypothetical protein
VTDEPADAAPPPSTDHERADRRLGVVAAVLLGLATVATAWSAYQANLWNGVMTSNYNDSVRLSTDAGKLYQEGDAINALDANLFAEWALATTEGNDEAADYLAENLFSEGLVAAVATWEAQGDDAPPSPFDLDEYVVPSWSAGDALEVESQEATDRADAANKIADDYVLVTVLLAVVLFTAGIAATLDTVRLKAGFLVFGGVVFLTSVGLLLSFPVE